MKSRTATTITTYLLLSLAGGISFMMPDELDVPDAPKPAFPAVSDARRGQDLHRPAPHGPAPAHPDDEIQPGDGTRVAGDVPDARAPSR